MTGPGLERKPRKPRWGKIFLIGGFLALAVGGLAYGFYVRPALAGYQRFRERLDSGQFHYSGAIEFYGQDFLSALDSKMNFAGRYDKGQGDMSFYGSWAKKDYQGKAALTNGQLYFRLLGGERPVIRYKQSNKIYPLTDQWYRARADGSLYDLACENRQPASLSSQVELYRSIRALKLQTSPIVLPTTLDGETAQHYRGTVDSAQLPALFDKLAAAQPAGCDLNTLGLTGADTKNWQAGYDLVTSEHKDQIKVTIDDPTLGSKLTLNLQLYNFGQDSQISPPEQFTDLSAVLKAL